MEFWVLLGVIGLLLWFPPTRGITKLWVIASVVLVWLLDSAAGDSLGD